MDIVITVCDNAAGESCPVYLNNATKVHWGLAEPSHIEGSEYEIMDAIEQTYGILEQRIKKMLSLSLESMSPEQLSAKLNALADNEN